MVFDNYVPLLRSLKHSEALLGSNLVRNRAVNSRLNGAGIASGCTCFFMFIRPPFKLRFQCQEKPDDEALAIIP